MVSARPEDDGGHGEEERVGRDLVEYSRSKFKNVDRHSHRSVQPTRKIWSPCVLIITVTCLLDRCFVITLCFLFFLSCNLFSWVLVSLGDPFTGFFVLLFVVPVLFHIQISARPSLSKGLFWTGLKAFAWVMPLFNIDLVSNPLCAD
jgi:succinate dehydrogenase hydrophobic anchor subunit